MPRLATVDERPSYRLGPDPALLGRLIPGGNINFPVGMMVSLVVHLLVILLLLSHVSSKGVRKPQLKKMVVISLESLREMGKPKAASSETMPPSPQPVSKMTPTPPPEAQAVPKPKHAPAPPKTAPAATAQPKAETRAPTPALKQNQAPAQPEKRGDEGESIGVTVLNRVRTNWLKPVGSSASFHCRLKIEYRTGGYITNAVVLNGCGTDLLDDSVIRAIWKTQPLPLDPAQNGPGSMVLEFTP